MVEKNKLNSTYDELQRNEQKLRFYENKRKRYESQIKNFARRERTHRLIERGAILEKHFPCSTELDNEELSYLLGIIFSKEATARMIQEFMDTHHPDATD